jgi:hypothetical protein
MESIKYLSDEWARLFPGASPEEWAALLAEHPQLKPEDWVGILARIKHAGPRIRVSASSYLETCIRQREDQLRNIHQALYVPGEDEL